MIDVTEMKRTKRRQSTTQLSTNMYTVQVKLRYHSFLLAASRVGIVNKVSHVIVCGKSFDDFIGTTHRSDETKCSMYAPRCK